MGRFRSSLFAVIAFALVPSASAMAQDGAVAPLRSAQMVIQNQIEAFLADDAEAAYGFASPAIKGRFPDKDRFFAMVQKSYKPVYQPGNFAFGRNKVLQSGGTVLQEVLVTGSEGTDWTAVYELMRQPDGAYKINGVQLMPNTNSKGI